MVTGAFPRFRGTGRIVDSGKVSEPESDPCFGAIITFAPKARNSVVRRRLASTWRLRRAAVTAAPAPRASNITKRRPGLAPKRRRMMRQNIARLLARRSAIIRLAGWAPARTVKRGVAEGRCQES